MPYAENTVVSSDKSRSEIERILGRYGATSFMYGWQGINAVIMFIFNGKHIRFTLTLPSRDERKFTHTPTGQLRIKSATEREYEQAVRQKWRALKLVIQAKLEAVESGISVFEEEFLANIVLPDNQTVAQFILPQVNEAYRIGKMPEQLPLLTGGKK